MTGSAITPFAWFFMVLSMGAVTALAAYCFYRILAGPRQERAAGSPGVPGEGGGPASPSGPAGAAPGAAPGVETPPRSPSAGPAATRRPPEENERSGG